ncbi:3D-(3 5/4)-trihydroxycyclohexane-1 2-dione hydrolase [Striga asiatica]|uniref:3D-(3 5/4)-trihydroxycyclohexane-1 2-dione hydrolase n=1 Tax=Striga asiatica TaxID=4170 RepID=A0A5A7PK76_STRAF|nr:3D-(3 5/4)-trihydroxycyclohexane-1 2-dione hydrolase [Striga asiatica]
MKGTIDLPRNRPTNLRTTPEAHTKTISLPQSSGELSPFQPRNRRRQQREAPAPAKTPSVAMRQAMPAIPPSPPGVSSITAAATREGRHLRRERRPHRGESLEPRRSRYPRWWSCANRPRGGSKI